jgi:hypothetical protein
MRNKTWLLLVAGASVSVGILVGAGLVYAQQRSTRVMNLTPQDYIDIQQLYARYAQAISLGDPEAYAGTFTPNGDIHVLQGDRHITGHKAIGETALGSRRRPRQNRAWPATPVITPTADGAKATSIFFSLNVSGKQAEFAFSGVYEDTLVKTRAGWHFKQRTFRHDDMLPLEVEP